MTTRKKSELWFWVPFFQNQSTCSDFAQISTDFARIFTKAKVFGVRLHPLHPRLLHQCPGWPQVFGRRRFNFNSFHYLASVRSGVM